VSGFPFTGPPSARDESQTESTTTGRARSGEFIEQGKLEVGMKTAYPFSVLRYVHDPVTAEFVNMGWRCTPRRRSISTRGARRTISVSPECSSRSPAITSGRLPATSRTR